jgi:hypothetical protein
VSAACGMGMGGYANWCEWEKKTKCSQKSQNKVSFREKLVQF